MIKKLVGKIENLLMQYMEDDEDTENFKAYTKVLGASDKQLADFEEEFQIKLPSDFREFYTYKNGSSYPYNFLYATYNEGCECIFYIMSLDEIREAKRFFCNENEHMEDFEDFFEQADIDKLDKRIKPYLFNKKWIPFAQLVGGSLYLMLDFDPTESGTEGQIIIYVHDPDFIYYVTDTFTHLLEDTIQSLKDQLDEEFYE